MMPQKLSMNQCLEIEDDDDEFPSYFGNTSSLTTSRSTLDQLGVTAKSTGDTAPPPRQPLGLVARNICGLSTSTTKVPYRNFKSSNMYQSDPSDRYANCASVIDDADEVEEVYNSIFEGIF
ncbi:uncharacterized protein LOC141898677 [Tubulanus polymorphus]|uniref:uncharacterized protein LOC141898677 n=1 Tax=Tubulanus polymorphus TaxID=672921 RepID=UPI003DA3865E